MITDETAEHAIELAAKIFEALDEATHIEALGGLAVAITAIALKAGIPEERLVGALMDCYRMLHDLPELRP